MADGISRREMVTFAGVGLGLSACSAAMGSESSTPGNATGDQDCASGDCDKTSRDRGICEEWGKYPSTKPGNDLAFNPGFIAIVFIDFKKKWLLSINHASFPIDPGSTPESRLAKALEILKDRANLPKHLKKFRHLKKKPWQRSDGDVDKDDFDSFGFKTQNEVFIYFDSDDVELDKDWLLSFTPKSDTGQSRDPNYAFLNALKVTHGEMSGLRGQMMRVRNYMLDCHGNTIGENNPDNKYKKQRYSMNIHFKLKTDGKSVSMIIDPDTGNGAGNEP